MRNAEYYLNHPIISLDDIRKILDMPMDCTPKDKRVIFSNCANCGAILNSNICEYCGTRF